jgi:hypothetical protein
VGKSFAREKALFGCSSKFFAGGNMIGASPFRHQRIMVKLLKAAVEYAKDHGAKIVEGYPIEAKESNLPSVSSFTGIASAFTEVGQDW